MDTQKTIYKNTSDVEKYFAELYGEVTELQKIDTKKT